MLQVLVDHEGHGSAGPRPPLRDVPLGFASAEEFRAFGAHLTGGLRAAGYDDVVPVFQGSSVTGVKYTTGAPFDMNRVSDFDIALASPALFERAKELGVVVRKNPTRTAPLRAKHLEQLGLLALRDALVQRAGRRPVAFMIYPDLGQTLARSPSIPVR